jgi:hypothetical protein
VLFTDPIGTELFLTRGDYGKKNLENANTKASWGFSVSL